MEILFIRHAKALDRSRWFQDDLERPLTQEGIEKAKEFFAKIRRLYTIDVIITSKAVRAAETAKLLLNYYPNAKYCETARLNPGASVMEIQRLIDDFRSYEHIALVGHEPDLSTAIAYLIGCETGGRIRMKKGGIAQVCFDGLDYTLCSLLYPKLLKGL
ncbi:MAG: phosphohistidine phosphatase [Epsilonproteobacteria bacterium]|nr:phosphohistidine phosphatase [Campylobacterota bacterium]